MFGIEVVDAAFLPAALVALAAGVLYPFTLSPEVAALSMSGSSAIVAINALMLKRTRLPGIKRVTSRASVPAAASA